jgi:hypothetical protein
VNEEHRQRIFENRVPRKIFWYKRSKVTGDWRKLHNDEHCNWYYSPNSIPEMKSRRMKWVRQVARSGEEHRLIKSFRGETWKKE